MASVDKRSSRKRARAASSATAATATPSSAAPVPAGKKQRRGDSVKDDDTVSADDAFFAARLDLVPLKMLLPVPEEPEDAWKARKFMKNKKLLAPKQSIKESTKKAKQKLEFANEGVPSNAERIREHVETERAAAAAAATSESDEQEHPTTTTTAAAQNYADLRERLARKVAEMRAKRTSGKAQNEGSDDDDGGDDDEQEQQHQVLSRKQRKQQEKAATRKAKKLKAKAAKSEQVQEHSDNKKKDELNEEQESVATLEQQLRDKVAASISYGNLRSDTDGAETSAAKSGTAVPRKHNLLNVKRLLRRAEENRAALEELKRSGRPEDKAELERRQWDRLERKAAAGGAGAAAVGEAGPDSDAAVLPEPKQLRKMAKRLERQKAKSAEAWAARRAAETDAKQQRIGKRESNIAAAKAKRVDARLLKKGIVPEQRRDEEGKDGGDDTQQHKRKRAGFEGRRTGGGFLNDGAAAAKAAKRPGGVTRKKAKTTTTKKN